MNTDIIEEELSELSGYLNNWAITEPELSLILGNTRRMLTTIYQRGRKDEQEEILKNGSVNYQIS